MVIDDLGLIFVHVPRTGGTSIEKIFNKALGDTSSPSKIVSEIGIEKWKQYFKFAVVRNPMDRLVSSYWYREQLKRFTQDQIINNQTTEITDPSIPFDLYVSQIYNLKNRTAGDIPDLQTQWLLAGGIFANHSDLLANYPSGQSVVDHMVRFENFAEDLKDVLNIFGKGGDVIPHLRKSIHNPYLNYYTQIEIDKVHEIYETDFTSLGYTTS